MHKLLISAMIQLNPRHEMIFAPENFDQDYDRSLPPDKILKLRIAIWYSRKQKSRISKK